MKLISNFQQLLLSDNAEQLPNHFVDWWELDDADLLFYEKYKEWFGFKPHHYAQSDKNDICAYTFTRELKNIKRRLGFNRTKLTRQELDLQKMFSKQYDEELIEQMCDFYKSFRDFREYQVDLQMHRECFRHGMTGEELSLSIDAWNGSDL